MQFDFNMVAYLLGLAATAGMIISRIAALEKKVERHNNMLERMYKLEEWRKSVEEHFAHLDGFHLPDHSEGGEKH